MDELTRSNIEQADALGLLDEHKRQSGVPQYYKSVTEEEIKTLQEAKVKYYSRIDKVQGPVYGGWVSPHVYAIIRMYENHEEYADMSLAEFLRKTVGTC